jgi:hypothetical protein
MSRFQVQTFGADESYPPITPYPTNMWAQIVQSWPGRALRLPMLPSRWVAINPSRRGWLTSYGDDAQQKDYTTQAAAAYATYSQNADPRIAAAVLEAKIANYKQMRAKAPFLRFFYDNEIAKQEAKLAALKTKLSIQEEGESATRQWRGLGQAGVAVGIVGGVALVAILAAVATRAARG